MAAGGFFGLKPFRSAFGARRTKSRMALGFAVGHYPPYLTLSTYRYYLPSHKNRGLFPPADWIDAVVYVVSGFCIFLFPANTNSIHGTSRSYYFFVLFLPIIYLTQILIRGRLLT